MKKNLWLAAMVGVALTGCVNEEVASVENQKELVTFSSVMKTQSRANVMGEQTGVKYNKEENFTVYAWTYQGAYADKGWSDLTSFFAQTGEEAVNDGGDSWVTSTTHYWPGIDYNLLFAAYSPANFKIKKKNAETGNLEEVNDAKDFKGVISYSNDGIKITNFEVQDKADYQFDLMYSDFAVDKNIDNGTQGVNLKFNHALSSIVFSASKSDNDIEYIINSIELDGNFISSGDFFQNITSNKPAWTFDTEDIRNDKKYLPTIINNNVATETELTKDASALLLIPQVLVDENGDDLAQAKVIIKYTKKSSTSELPGIATINLKDFIKPATADQEAGPIKEWKPGYRYVYHFSFGENKKIFFKPENKDWAIGGQADYTITY